jgi:hypothetical protein
MVLAGRWLSPVLGVVSVFLLGSSFYTVYARGRGTPASKVVVWLSAMTAAGFWALRLL